METRTVRIDAAALQAVVQETGRTPEDLRSETGIDSMLLRRISLGHNEITVEQAAALCAALSIDPRKVLHEGGEISDVLRTMED